MTDCPSENTLVDFAEGRLLAEARSRIHTHIDSCSECRALLAELARAPASPVEPTAKLEPPAVLEPNAAEQKQRINPWRALTKPSQKRLDKSGGVTWSVVQLVLGLSGSTQDPEGLRELLHRRLRQLFSVTASALGVLLLRGLLDPVLRGTRPLGDNLWLIVCFLVSSGGAALLSARRSLSLLTLRGLECILLAAACVTICLLNQRMRDVGNAVAQLPPQEAQTLLTGRLWVLFRDGSMFSTRGYYVLGGSISFNFGFFSIAYGMFIPNTWRRSLLVLLGILAFAEVSVVQTALTVPGLRTDLVPFMVSVFLTVAMYGSIGLYSGHKLTVLRRVEREASAVGQYVLDEQIGRGGMGEVYRARHRMLRRPCAVKLIRADQAGSANALARFELEVQAMASLTHPNTVEVYDYGRTVDGTLYYAMEYLPGLSLDALVRAHGPLPAHRVMYLLRQICRALREAHAAGLIHRDIKPGNIFVTERGGERDVIKLLDFGLVRMQSIRDAAVGVERKGNAGATRAAPNSASAAPNGLTIAGNILGTPAFMAPEQIEGAAESSSDIYSVGTVAYFALTGRPPFQRSTLREMYQAHLQDPPEKPSLHAIEVPADVEAIVLRCLAKLPNDRYTSADELEAALASCACAASWDAAKADVWWRQVEGPAKSELPSHA